MFLISWISSLSVSSIVWFCTPLVLTLRIIKLNTIPNIYSPTVVSNQDDIKTLNKLLDIFDDVNYSFIIEFMNYGVYGKTRTPVIITNSPAQKEIAWFNAVNNAIYRYACKLENGTWTITPKGL